MTSGSIKTYQIKGRKVINMRKRLRKIDLATGSIELVGYMVCLPFLMIMILILISTVQTSIARQNLEFASYSATRAGALSSTYSLAKKRTEKIIDTYLHGDEAYGINPVISVIHNSDNVVNGQNDCIDYYLLYTGDDPKYGEITYRDGALTVGSKYYSDEYNGGNAFTAFKTNEKLLNNIWDDCILITEVTVTYPSICPFMKTKTIKTQQIMKVE